MHVSSLALFTGVVLSAAACGGSDSDPISLEDLPARYAAAACEQIFDCCDATEQAFQFASYDPPPTNQAECEVAFAARYREIAIDEAALAAGRLGYDGAAAAECIAAIEGLTCGGTTGTDACQRIFVGQVAVGATCEDDDECAGEAWCQGGLDECVALPPIGAACDISCMTGAYCDFSIGTGTCVALKSNGTACSLGGECQSGYCDEPTDLCETRPPSTTCDGN